MARTNRRQRGDRAYLLSNAVLVALLGLLAALLATEVAGLRAGHDLAIAKSMDDLPFDPDAIPDGPIHWHVTLDISINGSLVEIPAGVGLAGGEAAPIHTHEQDNVLHIEQDRPNRETLELGYFFAIWGKTFNSTCIMEYCGPFTMEVNWEESKAYSQYLLHDGDEIVIWYGNSSEA